MEEGSSSKSDERPIVVSAGNSWVVCRSKSHPGRIYYFNTLTGEAAWNLSETEIEKAKRTTKNLSNQASVTIENCPEPKDPPMDNLAETFGSIAQNVPSPSTVYNKQVINNQFSKPFPLNPFVVSPCNTILPGLNALVPVNASNTGFNSNIWTVPPPQFFLASSVSPLVHQSKNSANHAFTTRENFPVQSTSTAMTNRFQNFSHKRHISPQKSYEMRNNLNQRNENFRIRRGKYYSNKTIDRRLSNVDLRNKLSAKRKMRISQSDDSTQTNIDDSIDDKTETIVQGDHDLCDVSQYTEELDKDNEDCLDADSDWIEENLVAEGNKLKLNVSNLKMLASADTNKNCWFIVTDKDILLNHLNFLNILYNSDECCRLMVPTEVLGELRSLQSAGGLRTARRAARAVTFLSQLLDSGRAISGEGSLEEADTRSKYLINCCTNLLEQKYHVILLSNNKDLRNWQSSVPNIFDAKEGEKDTNVPIFSVKDIQHFLTKPFVEPKPVTTSCQQTPIKITISNDLIVEPPRNTTSVEYDKSTKQAKLKTRQQKEKKETEIKGTTTQSDSNKLVKHHTKDTGVQTDTELMSKELAPVDRTDITPQQEDAHDKLSFGSTRFNEPSKRQAAETHSNDENRCNESLDTENQSFNKREIRLNRSISKNTTTNEETSVTKKQFKWRRKKNISTSEHTNDTRLESPRNIDGKSNNTAKQKVCSYTQSEDIFNKSLTIAELQISTEDSESNSSVHRNVTNESGRNVTIEESSTSDIISNTISNADSESETGKKTDPKSTSNDRNKKAMHHSILFEVKDQNMEEYLKMRCDEWVSRFLQIMEEVLTQVMQRDQKFLQDVVYRKYGGGPWMIPEAIECIKKKYKDNWYIIDSSKKLKKIYLKVSDKTGRISTRIQPHEYMEMYSYGVYLVEMLQSVCSDCEDVRTAAQSLSNLLNDIRHPNLDTSNNDNFGEQNQVPLDDVNSIHEDEVTNLTTVSVVTDSSPQKLSDFVLPSPKTTNSSPKIAAASQTNSTSSTPKNTLGGSPRKIASSSPKDITMSSPKIATTLSPRKATPSPKEADSPVKRITRSRSKISLTSKINITPTSQPTVQSEPSLSQKDDETGKTETERLISNKKTISQGMESEPSLSQKDFETGKTETEGLISNKKTISQSQPNPVSEVTFIRNFKVADAFFSSLHLQKKFSDNTGCGILKTKEISDALEAKDSEKTNDPEIIRKFTVIPEYDRKIKQVHREPLDMNELDYSEDYGDEDGEYIDEEFDMTNSDVYYSHVQDNEMTPSISNVSTENNMNLNNNFNFIFNKILREIKEALAQLHIFCKRTCEELSNSTYSNSKKIEIVDKAEKAEKLIGNLSKSLHSIYHRDHYETENSIQSVLKNEGFVDVDLSNDHLKDYRDLINKSLEQAKELQDSVAIILNIAKNKPLNES